MLTYLMLQRFDEFFLGDDQPIFVCAVNDVNDGLRGNFC